MSKNVRKQFEYEALDAEGQVHSDIVTAENHKEVIAICVKRGLFPRGIRQLSKKAAANYGRLPKLKALKEVLENPPTPQSEYSSMPFQIEDEYDFEMPKAKLNIDWTYVLFIMLIAALVVGSAILKQ